MLQSVTPPIASLGTETDPESKAFDALLELQRIGGGSDPGQGGLMMELERVGDGMDGADDLPEPKDKEGRSEMGSDDQKAGEQGWTDAEVMAECLTI